MRLLLAFLKRDWQIHKSYRLSLLLQVGGALVAAVPFFFVGKLVDSSASSAMAAYGGYFPFVLLGLACSRFVTTSLAAFGGVLREEQVQGTLEALLLSPASLASVVLGGALWPFVWTTLEVFLYFLLGALLFGVSLTQINAVSALALLPLLILSLSSIGMLSACGMLLFKEGDPINWVLGGLMRLVGGVYFPVALLPGWLKAVAGWFPLTYGLDGLRQAVLTGASLNSVAPVLVALGSFCIIGWVVAIPAFLLSMRHLKQTGTLNFR